jgi:hypothetical protein
LEPNADDTDFYRAREPDGLAIQFRQKWKKSTTATADRAIEPDHPIEPFLRLCR